MDQDTDPELLTLGAAARACNRSKATISRAVRSGRLPAKAATDNGAGWLIRRDDLDRVFPPLETVTERLRGTPPRSNTAYVTNGCASKWMGCVNG